MEDKDQQKWFSACGKVNRAIGSNLVVAINIFEHVVTFQKYLKLLLNFELLLTKIISKEIKKSPKY